MTSLPVTIALARPLFDAATEPVRLRIAEELAQLVDELGVDSKLDVRLEVDADPARRHPIRVTVAGRVCLVPRWVPAQALAYVTGTPLMLQQVDGGELALHLGSGDGMDLDRLGELIALVSRSAVSARADVLLPDGDPLAVVLRLGMSIPGRNVDALRAPYRSASVEPLLAELAAPTVDLLVEPDYLQALTTSQDGSELFPFMRDGLFVELGLSFPPMRLRPDPSLRPGGFAFRVNGIRTLPRIGLEMGTIYINDVAERLRLMNVDAKPSANPATHQPGAVGTATHKDFLEADGLTVWDPFGYYILALADVIRSHAYTLMVSRTAHTMLDTLGKAFPAVTVAAREDLPADVVAQTLRALLRDGVSVRNLRRILELLLRHHATPEEAGDLDRVSFIRAGLADAIATKAARGTRTVVVYLLDPEIERALADPQAMGFGIDAVPAERLRNALDAEMSHLPPTAQIPLVLTGEKYRAVVRDVLWHEFPHLHVVSYRDIPPDYNIQPVARISWR